ncbi:MAG: asparaginase [Nannocystaceae bacterium]
MAEPEINNKKVCLLYVGGTIGMRRDERGSWIPDLDTFEAALQRAPELSHPDMPSYDLVSMSPLLDSAQLRPTDWVRIASAIESRYEDYDGFVVIHGTDTMAYSASALSFLVQDLGKPIIFTGAQLSLADPRSDGRQHLVTSLIIAGQGRAPEVGIYFADALFRGNRAQKFHNESFVAFSSGNFPVLARAGVTINYRKQLIRQPTAAAPTFWALNSDPAVVAARVYPGLRGEALELLTRAPVRGLVLESYGSGNVPSDDRTFMKALERAIESDIVVVNTSQCHRGRVRQGRYGTGARLRDAGVVSGGDMTPEATLTKLYCLLGRGYDAEKVRTMMGQDLAGERSQEDDTDD